VEVIMMRSKAALAAAFLLLAACGRSSASTPAPAEAPLATEDAKTIYAMGTMMGGQIAAFKLSQEDLAAFIAGFKDAASGTQSKVPMDTYGPKIQTFLKARMDAAAVIEKDKGRVYAEKAATEAGAQKTAAGAVVIGVTEGKGAFPTPADTVKVHYKGTLLDGTVFDSSYDRGQPAEFPLGGVVKCWTEGLQKVKVGGKAKLVCPSDTAYGDQGRPPKIPGGATLLFEVELLEAGPAPAPAAMPDQHPPVSKK
jgi:FKBP-type peptidyl-prolyl cis-trans isomerase FkpA